MAEENYEMGEMVCLSLPRDGCRRAEDPQAKSWM